MCGIFALFNNSVSLNDLDKHTIDYIQNNFNKGQCRGPENSIFKFINDNIIFNTIFFIQMNYTFTIRICFWINL